jgi:hypothetical protein
LSQDLTSPQRIFDNINSLREHYSNAHDIKMNSTAEKTSSELETDKLSSKSTENSEKTLKLPITKVEALDHSNSSSSSSSSSNNNNDNKINKALSLILDELQNETDLKDLEIMLKTIVDSKKSNNLLLTRLDEQKEKEEEESELHLNDKQTQLIINKKIVQLLASLLKNDGFEKYGCELCSYLCYHLPSLKSHMWTHIRNSKFDYTANTGIINMALDYEITLSRNLSLFQNKNLNDNSISTCVTSSKNIDLNKDEKTIINNGEAKKSLINKIITQLIDCPQSNKLSNETETVMVSFRCSMCTFGTTDLSQLRAHKMLHYYQLKETTTH